MRIQNVNSQPNFDCLRAWFIKSLLNLLWPIFSGAAFGGGNMPLAGQRFNSHKYLGYTISHIFILNTSRFSRLARNCCMNFIDQLLAGLVQTDHQIILIIRQVVHFQDILHRRYKGCTSFWWDFPVFFGMRFAFIFLITCCTVMCETDGASEQARVISRASSVSSKITSRGGLTCGLRTRTASSPSPTKFFCNCSIILPVTPSTAVTSKPFRQDRPSGHRRAITVGYGRIFGRDFTVAR